ncbi:UDP-2,4-diacetamido-2,4,6-trideoxy-beta-L-altropyranose hydrolase [Bacillus tuaregi]|uniref:UDP-2,4-diacetamido-2,4, 6-trideoxy-beta-L-altropyranose hydrolase n=1 Tax=Bacillus tuaregi TaxID=1816695 RepID=UPI0008F83024|nr:UDP-2,4-diacetamido-2,4,6-trideoxy-beta-L-altropyranose hydrolase [Bacillus tuaregi]
MKVFFRVDASKEIGTGHVMRCLTLAETLRSHGATVSFICREHAGHLCDFIEAKGFIVSRLPPPTGDAPLSALTSHSHWLGVPWEIDAEQTKALLQGYTVDWLMVDHYAISLEWEHVLKGIAKRIMVIDDLGDRKHDCDLLMDPTALDAPLKYRSLVPPYCRLFLGPSYVLLRPEFVQQRSHMKHRTGSVKRIFLFFGGFDPTNETGKALTSFLELNRTDIEVDVVVGQSNLHKQQLKALCDQHDQLHFHCQINHMALLMRQADIAIGAGGTTTWERCYLGLPSIVWSLAENQRSMCEYLGKRGIIHYLGESHQVKPILLTEQLKAFLADEKERAAMSQRSADLMKNHSVDIQLMIKYIIKMGD